MRPVNSSSPFKKWINPNRIIPLLTILGAGTAIVLSLLGLITLSIAESIIIALLALLASDALSERLSVLEKIESRLSSLSFGQPLRARTDLPSIEERAGHASEICIIAVSAISLVTNHLSFFEKKIQDGCKIRFLLLDPNGPSLQTWDLLSYISKTEPDIKRTLEYLKKLVQIEQTKGKCEIRLTQVLLPFSMVAIDLQKNTGSMVVEYHIFKTAFSERPHVFLTRQNSSKWFDFYRQQFEQAWSEATVWTP